MKDGRASGTLIVTLWKSAYFWPLLCSDGVHLNSFVAERMYLPRRPDLFVKGRAKHKFFATEQFSSRCLALRIDLAVTCDRRSDARFCTSSSGFCFVCQC